MATKEGQCIGIEIETGKSDVVSNVKNGLRSGLDKIITVATDAGATTIIQRQLADSSLQIPSRILIVRAGIVP